MKPGQGMREIAEDLLDNFNAPRNGLSDVEYIESALTQVAKQAREVAIEECAESFDGPIDMAFENEWIRVQIRALTKSDT